MKTVILLDVGYLLPSQIKSADMLIELMQRVALDIYGKKIDISLSPSSWWYTYSDICLEDKLIATYELFTNLVKKYIGVEPDAEDYAVAANIMKGYMDSNLIMGEALKESITTACNMESDDVYVSAFGNCTIKERDWLAIKFPKIMHNALLSCEAGVDVFQNDVLHSHLCNTFGEDTIRMGLLTQHLNDGELVFDVLSPCPYSVDTLHGWVSKAMDSVLRGY